SCAAVGHRWMDHEWLAEVPYYLAWHAFGPVGVYVTLIVVLEAILLGVFYLASKGSGNVKGAWLASCFSVLLAAVSFGPRTLLFGYVYLLFLFVVLQQFRAKGQAPLWVSPLAFCCVCTTHGSVLMRSTVCGF